MSAKVRGRIDDRMPIVQKLNNLVGRSVAEATTV